MFTARSARLASSAGSARPARRRVVGLALTAALLCGLAAPAPALAAGPTAAEIAEALERSPVYVAGELRAELPPERQRSLERRIKQTGLPIKVLLVPLDYDDRWGGEGRQLTTSVRERMEVPDDEHLIMIAAWEQMIARIEAHEWPNARYEARYAAFAVSSQERAKGGKDGKAAKDGSSPVDLVERAIPIVEAGDGKEQYRAARSNDPYLSDSGAGRGEKSQGLLLLGGVVVLVLVGGGVAWVLRRRRSAQPFAVPRHVFTAAREQSESALRARAQSEVLRLGEELRGLEASGSCDLEVLRKALDAYAAAGRVWDDAQHPPDLAGVLALVTEGWDALAANQASRQANSKASGQASKAKGVKRKQVKGRGAAGGAVPLPLCFFHPQHGRAVKRTAWRPLGRRESLRVAVCAACGSAVSGRRAPEALADQYEEREVPYFEVPAEHSLWTATGFGSFGTESLTARVMRGDFSRAAAARADAAAD